MTHILTVLYHLLFFLFFFFSLDKYIDVTRNDVFLFYIYYIFSSMLFDFIQVNLCLLFNSLNFLSYYFTNLRFLHIHFRYKMYNFFLSNIRSMQSCIFLSIIIVNFITVEMIFWNAREKNDH